MLSRLLCCLSLSFQKTVHCLPDKLLLEIFSYLRLSDLCRLARVCKRWRHLAYDGRLWTRVSLRPEYSGLHVTNVDALTGILTIRCGYTLRYLELPAELIMPALLHELASRFVETGHRKLREGISEGGKEGGIG